MANIHIVLRITDDYVGEVDNEFIVDKKEPIKAFSDKAVAEIFIQANIAPYVTYEIVTLELE